jgi:DNA repair protein RecO (recombination protein O)
MNQIVTKGIVLRRTDFGEADRIVVLLTPDHGKLSLVAKGVRRLKSKLAGGIELFSISSITFIKGRGELGTLISARLEQNFANIVTDITRVQLGYELIKLLGGTVEDDAEQEFFNLLATAFSALNDLEIPADLVQIWFSAQMLRLTGHTPNVETTLAGKKLSADSHYNFSLDDMAFSEHPAGDFGANEIKFMRLVFSDASPKVLSAVRDAEKYTQLLAPLLRIMAADYLHS